MAKENAILKVKRHYRELCNLKDMCIEELEKKLVYQKQARSIAENTVVDLTKENAELKARLNAINSLTPELEKQSKAEKQQLTKSKEIIKKLLNFAEIDNREYEYVYKEAEQFLKDSEVK